MFKKKITVDRYFLNDPCQFSGKRTIKMKSVKIASVALLVLAVVGLLFVDDGQDLVADTAKEPSPIPPQAEAAISSQAADLYIPSGYPQGDVTATRISAPSSREFTASQLVGKTTATGAYGSSRHALPMGSTIPAILVNTALSSDSASPVTALITDDVVAEDGVVIAKGTKAIGQASFDDRTKRLQVRFGSFVSPEGDEYQVSALALMPDGSAGIPGEYYSGSFKAQVGRFLGYFTGGVAEGMKDKQTNSSTGITMERGSVRNGVLNGIVQSSVDQAQSYAEEVGRAKPYIEVAGGAHFLLYFDKGFSP